MGQICISWGNKPVPFEEYIHPKNGDPQILVECYEYLAFLRIVIYKLKIRDKLWNNKAYLGRISC